MKYDWIIKNALVADGISPEPFAASVGVRHGKIHSVSNSLEDKEAKNVFDANGGLLCPGFIDTHSHSDISIMASERNIGKISQGFTTEITGNCGLSPFPVTQNNRGHLRKLYSNYKINISWESFSEYKRLLNDFKPVCNIAPLCGYNTLRAASAGYQKKRPSPAELQKVLYLLEASMKEGAFGLSGGFLYVPGIYANSNELKLIFNRFSNFDRIYTVHLRSEGDFLLESLKETFELALDAGLPRVHISHFKTAGRKNWDKIAPALEIIEKYKKMGLAISADRYPFIESMTSLSAFLPPPWNSIDDVRLMSMIKNSVQSKKLAESIRAGDICAWENRRLVWTDSFNYRRLCGLKFSSIARKTGKKIPEICVELLADDAPGTVVSSQGMRLSNMRRIISQDYVFCGSDESNRPLDYSLGRSHPRAFASAPRFFQELMKKFDICEAIRRMSVRPAEIFKIKKRGKITPGYHADIVLFSPQEFRGTANFANPHRLCRGIEKVWVNGVLSYDGARKSLLTRAGKVLDS